jgi:EmrB/QacA subfamily drug resistance transporter
MPERPRSTGTTPHRIGKRLLVEAARPRRVASDPRAAWLTVLTVSLGAFMGQLDASIVNIGYPTLQEAFHASLGAVQWVGLSYLMVLIAAVAAVGRVSDMLGRKLLYTYGFVVFGVGSGLCALAPGLVWLDAFRVVQAIGAVMLQANSVAIITATLSRDRLGRGIGVQGTAQALGLAFGPFVGGLLIGLGGWRLIFLVNVPIALVGVVTSWLFVPRSRNLTAREPFDWLGLALFVPSLVALLVALSFGNERGWTSAEIVTLLVIWLCTTGGFVIRERRARYPLIDLSLFYRRRFSIGVSTGLASFLVLFGVLFVTPFYLQRSQGFSAAAAGAILTVLPLAMAAIALLAGRAVDRIGARPPTILGMLITAAGLAIAAANPTTADLVIALVLAGLGIGMFTPSNNASLMSSVPRRRVGVASGVVNLTRGLGAALGLSATALVFDHATQGSRSAAATSDGFTRSLIMLALVALAAAALSLLRRPKADERPVE